MNMQEEEEVKVDEFERKRVQWEERLEKALVDSLKYDNKNHLLKDVVISYVHMNKSLRSAKVKWMPNTVNEWRFEQLEKVNKLLNHARGFFGACVSARLDKNGVRRVPILEFFYDIDPRDKSLEKKVVDKREIDVDRYLSYAVHTLKSNGANITNDDLERLWEENKVFRKYKVVSDSEFRHDAPKQISKWEKQKRVEQSNRDIILNARKK
ncbi:hypothetical protein AKO1_011444, partial [Acrasis kona]